MESIALQQGDCLKSSTSCSAERHPCSSPWKSLRCSREKKSSVKATRRERETLCVFECIPFALVFVFGRREGGDLVSVCQFAPHLTTQKCLACALHRAWKGMTKKTKEESPWINLTLWSSGVFFFTFLFLFLFFENWKKGMVLLHTLKM